MSPDDALEQILALARDQTISDDDLRDRVREVIEQLAPEQRDAAILRAKELLAEQRAIGGPSVH